MSRNNGQGRVLVWAIRRGGFALKVVNTLLRCDFYARDIGEGLYVPHAFAITVHSRCRVGNEVTIYQCVTLGESRPGSAVPIVEDGVVIGAGAVVIGGVTLGEGCRIGANAVVLEDVPPQATAAGVPARVIGG